LNRQPLWFNRLASKVPAHWRSGVGKLAAKLTPGRRLEPQPVPPELKAELRAHFTPMVHRLSDLIGRDLSHWTRPS
jgi:hypothetical protein